MRFQTTNRVPYEDVELVLAVLEDRLHTLAHEVVREGQRITLFGLGPSPRAVNPRDKTMIDVKAADGVTTIDADVTFQASAFLGETPQDQIVRGKLERVFDEINAELELKVKRNISNGVSPTRKIVPIKGTAEPVVAASNGGMAAVPPKGSAGMIAVAEEEAEVLEDVSTAVVAGVDQEPVEVAITAEPVASIPIVAFPSDDISSAVEEAEIAQITPAPITRVDEEPADSIAIAESVASVPIVASSSADVWSAVVDEVEIAEIASGPTENARVDVEPVNIAPIPAVPTKSFAERPIRIVFAEPEPEKVVEPEPIAVSKPETIEKPKAIEIEKPDPIEAWEPEPIPVAKPRPVAVRKQWVLVPVERKREAERWVANALSGLDEKDSGTWRRVGWTAAAVGLVAIVIFGARDLMNLDQTQVDSQPVTVSAMTSTSASTPEPVPTTPAPTAVAPTTVSSTTAPVPDAKSPLQESNDPAEVVKQWELAMQSRDAASQAAFYADPVGRYFLRDNVPKNAVLADKQAEIDKRKGSWTIKMERVKVDRQGDVATVSLVKHFSMQGEGDPASEWFIPAQLKLKREDGQWRIVSERSLGWASSLDDLDG